MILCVGATPAEQRVMVFRKLSVDAVNRATKTLDGVAGKSVNVAKVLKSLGEEPLATGFLGGDRGDRIRAALKQRAIAEDFIKVNAPTRQCITVIDESAGTQTELVEESRPVPPKAYDRLMAVVRGHIRKSSAVVMSGTITPGGPENLYFQIARLSGAVGALSVVDARGPLLTKALEAKPGLIKPNRAELAATVDRPLEEERQLRSAMREMCERGAQRIVVTAGKEVTLASDGCSVWRIFSPRIKALNPIGSGDAFTAGLVWRLLRGDELGEACRWASAAGAANALTMMAGEVRRRDVVKLAARVKMQRVRS